MASVKVKLWTHKTSKDGSHPVRIEVIHDRKRAVQTLFNLHSNHWDDKYQRVKKTHPRSSSLNADMDEVISRCSDRIKQLERDGVNYTAGDVFYTIDKSSLLLDAINDYLKGFEYSNTRKYSNLADKIREYNASVTVNQIDVNFMDKFKQWLHAQKRINSTETVHRYLKSLKTILNAQYKKGNYNDREVLAYSAPEGNATKVALTRKEFEAIAAVQSDSDLYRDCFLLMTYLRGIRIGDMLQMRSQHVYDDRVRFTEQKTGQHRDIKIRREAMEIINKYQGQSPFDYVLPIMELPPADPKTDRTFAKHIEVKTSVINRELKLIAALAQVRKKISTHVSRHTYASLAYDSKLSYAEIQKLLGHQSPRVTEKYIKDLKEHDDADEADEKVF